MRRSIETIARSLTSAVDIRRSGHAVIVGASLGLRALYLARVLLAWLAGMAPVGTWAVVMGRWQPAVAVTGADRVLGWHRLNTMRPRGYRFESRFGARFVGF